MRQPPSYTRLPPWLVLWTLRGRPHCRPGPSPDTSPLPHPPPATRSAATTASVPPAADDGPVRAPAPAPHYSFLQWNLDGIQSSKAELETFLHRHKVKVAALQETKLHQNSPTLSFPGCTLLRKDRLRNTGGGLAFLIHDSISYSELTIDPRDQFLEVHCVTITIRNSPLNILNLYLPSASSCPSHTLSEDTLVPFFSSDADTLALGDLNAHSEAWFSRTSCDRAAARGETVAATIDCSTLIVLNSPVLTHPLSVPSSPDLSLISAHLATAVEWQVHHKLNSDHLPNTISFTDDTPPVRSRCTYTNFKRADWPSFTSRSETKF